MAKETNSEATRKQNRRLAAKAGMHPGLAAGRRLGRLSIA
jgi:hypothetical protein